MEAADLLDYVLSQTKQNIEFLIANGRISQQDGKDILAKLSHSSLYRQTESLSISDMVADVKSKDPSPPSVSVPKTADPPQISLTTQSKFIFRARAIWNYNEHGQEPNDLSFYAGDTIEVTEQTNADWWMGRHKGQEGLFPSNYVERILVVPPTAPTVPRVYEKVSEPLSAPESPLNSPSPYPKSSEFVPGAGYSPSAPAYTQYPAPSEYQQPPPSQPFPYPAYGPDPTASPPSSAASPEEVQKPHKKKFGGKLGNTLAHTAVGGVGFGAGSAIGSGIINSLF